MYRDASTMLLCPRCAELLDDLNNGVWFCLRCEGLWIRKPAIAKLTDLPIGRAAWWRNSIDCPECATQETKTVMQARMTSELIVDLCSQHGGWFDRGELSRLMSSDDSDLDTLRTRIAVARPSPEDLARRRKKLDEERALRQRAAEAYRNATESEEMRAEREKAARAAAEKEAKRLAEIEEKERKRKAALAERQRAYEAKLEELREERDVAERNVKRLESRLEEDRRALVEQERRIEQMVGKLDQARKELVDATKAFTEHLAKA